MGINATAKIMSRQLTAMLPDKLRCNAPATLHKTGLQIMSPASGLQYSAIFKASVVAGKRIDLQNAAVAAQMRTGVLPLAIGRVLEPNRRRGRISASPVIAHIGP